MNAQPLHPAPRLLGIFVLLLGASVCIGSFFKNFFQPVLDVQGYLAQGLVLGSSELATIEALSGPNTALNVSFLVLSAALIPIGIGLMGYKAWARKAGIIWGALGIVLLAVQASYYFSWWLPGMDGFFVALATRDNQDVVALREHMQVLEYITLILLVPTPLIMVGGLTREAIVNAMKG